MAMSEGKLTMYRVSLVKRAGSRQVLQWFAFKQDALVYARKQVKKVAIDQTVVLESVTAAGDTNKRGVESLLNGDHQVTLCDRFFPPAMYSGGTGPVDV